MKLWYGSLFIIGEIYENMCKYIYVKNLNVDILKWDNNDLLDIMG